MKNSPDISLGYLAMICTTIIAVAFLKYWTPFIEFRMKFYQQERILDAIEGISKPKDIKRPQDVVFAHPLPTPDLPPEPTDEPLE